MKNRIIYLCEEIKENLKCKGCGEIKDRNGNCRKCYSEDYEFKNLVDELVECLNNCSIDEDILLSLYNIRFLNSTKIHLILNEHGYNKYVNNKFDEINNKFKDIFELKKNSSIDESDLKYIFYFLENDYYSDNESLLITNRLMALLMNKKIIIDIEQQLNLVIYFTKNNMKNIYPNIGKVKCCFEKENIKLGQSFYDKVYLDKDKIINLLNGFKYIDLIECIFYECSHTLIYNQIIHLNTANYINLLNTKELIIKDNIKNYYYENINTYSHNTYSRYYACILLLQFLKQFGWDNVYKDYIINKINKETQLITLETRKLNNTNTTIDELFDSLELNPSILKEYPALNFEYKIGDEYIVRKTKEEIEQDYMNYLQKHGESDEIHKLFNKLIQKYKNNIL